MNKKSIFGISVLTTLSVALATTLSLAGEPASSAKGRSEVKVVDAMHFNAISILIEGDVVKEVKKFTQNHSGEALSIMMLLDGQAEVNFADRADILSFQKLTPMESKSFDSSGTGAASGARLKEKLLPNQQATFQLKIEGESARILYTVFDFTLAQIKLKFPGGLPKDAPIQKDASGTITAQTILCRNTNGFVCEMRLLEDGSFRPYPLK